MSWHYTNNPTNVVLDAVRLLIADTDQTQSWSLTDEEIQYAIDLYPTNYLLAAALSAEMILGRFKSTISADSKSVGDLSVSTSADSQSIGFYQNLARQLRARAALKGVGIFVGGRSKLDKATREADSDRIQTAARVDGMNINTSSGSEDDE